MLADIDPFDRFPLPARQARFAPWCFHHKRTATQRADKGSRPSVARGIKWVNISEHWYLG
jgi:hypothetical protein